MGSTSQSTAAPDTSAYRLVLIPRSTSTGKVAMEAQAEIQTVSHKPPAKPKCFPLPEPEAGVLFSLPAVFPDFLTAAHHGSTGQVPTTAAKES